MRSAARRSFAARFELERAVDHLEKILSQTIGMVG